MCMFCRSLFVLLFLFFLPLCCLSSFDLRLWLSLWYLQTILTNIVFERFEDIIEVIGSINLYKDRQYNIQMKSKSSEESLDSVSYTKYLSKTLILDTKCTFILADDNRRNISSFVVKTLIIYIKSFLELYFHSNLHVFMYNSYLIQFRESSTFSKMSCTFLC